MLNATMAVDEYLFTFQSLLNQGFDRDMKKVIQWGINSVQRFNPFLIRASIATQKRGMA